MVCKQNMPRTCFAGSIPISVLVSAFLALDAVQAEGWPLLRFDQMGHFLIAKATPCLAVLDASSTLNNGLPRLQHDGKGLRGDKTLLGGIRETFEAPLFHFFSILPWNNQDEGGKNGSMVKGSPGAGTEVATDLVAKDEAKLMDSVHMLPEESGELGGDQRSGVREEGNFLDVLKREDTKIHERLRSGGQEVKRGYAEEDGIIANERAKAESEVGKSETRGSNVLHGTEEESKRKEREMLAQQEEETRLWVEDVEKQRIQKEREEVKRARERARMLREREEEEGRDKERERERAILRAKECVPIIPTDEELEDMEKENDRCVSAGDFL